MVVLVLGYALNEYCLCVTSAEFQYLYQFVKQSELCCEKKGQLDMKSLKLVGVLITFQFQPLFQQLFAFELRSSIWFFQPPSIRNFCEWPRGFWVW